jgi:hypothetical protein
MITSAKDEMPLISSDKISTALLSPRATVHISLMVFLGKITFII